VGIIIPVYLVRVENRTVKFAFDILRSVSIGLIIGVALLHMLADSNNALSSVYPDYPFAMLFAGVGACLMLFMEQITVHLSETPEVPKEPAESESTKESVAIDEPVSKKEENQKENHEGHSHANGEHSHGVGDHSHHSHGTSGGHSHGSGGHSHEADDLHSHHSATLDAQDHKLRAYMIEGSIAIHSVLIGVGLGVLNDFQEVEILLVALCFHQLFEGIALGGAVAKAKSSKAFLSSLICLFSFSCPIGIGIGSAVASSFEDGDPAGVWAQGVLNSIACGTLLYIGMYDLMVQNFNRPNPGWKKFEMVFAVFVGVCVMAVLAIWA